VRKPVGSRRSGSGSVVAAIIWSARQGFAIACKRV